MLQLPNPSAETNGFIPAAPPPEETATDEQDWTEDLPQSDHVRFFREVDWSRTKLGPLKDWGTTLRTFVRMAFADSRPACLWWYDEEKQDVPRFELIYYRGPDLVAIYNEVYTPLSAGAHPKLMGQTFRDGYPEIWNELRSHFDNARQSGMGQNFSSGVLILERKGWREEAFFTGNFVPVGGGPTNQPEGFYNSCFEITTQRLSERRTSMLNRMA